MEYPHWLMVAGAVLVVVGFVALGFSLNRNLEQTQDNVHPAPPPNSSVAGEEMSARHLSAGLWKPADDDQLRDMAAFGRSSSEIGRLLHRSPSAVRKRASLFGIEVQGWWKRLARTFWTPEKDDRLRMLLGAGKPIEFVAAELKRSAKAVMGRAYVLRISLKHKLKPKAKEEWRWGFYWFSQL